MPDAVEEEANTAYLRVMVDDAIEIPVELPDDQVLGLFEAKGLVCHQRKDRIRRHAIGNFFNGYQLFAARIEDDGVEHFLFPV